MHAIKRVSQKTSLLEKASTRLLRKSLERRSRRHLQKHPIPMAVLAFDFIGNEIATNGLYELSELECIFEILKNFESNFKDGTACDIGANIGNHTRYFANKFKKVVAFEPNKLLTEILKFNIASYDNIEISQFALGDFQGRATLVGERINLGGMSISPERKLQHKKFSDEDIFGTEIQVTTLDSMQGILENLQFMKIDVEGFEYSVLSGANQMIRSFKPVIAFEQWPTDFVNSNSQAINLLREMGYSFCWPTKYSRSNWVLVKFVSKFLQSIIGRTRLYIEFSEEVPSGHYSMLLAIHKTKMSKLGV